MYNKNGKEKLKFQDKIKDKDKKLISKYRFVSLILVFRRLVDGFDFFHRKYFLSSNILYESTIDFPPAILYNKFFKFIFVYCQDKLSSLSSFHFFKCQCIFFPL